MCLSLSHSVFIIYHHIKSDKQFSLKPTKSYIYIHIIYIYYINHQAKNKKKHEGHRSILPQIFEMPAQGFDHLRAEFHQGPWAMGQGGRLRMKGSMVGAPNMLLLYRKNKKTTSESCFPCGNVFCCLSMFGNDKCSQRCDEYWWIFTLETIFQDGPESNLKAPMDGLKSTFLGARSSGFNDCSAGASVVIYHSRGEKYKSPKRPDTWFLSLIYEFLQSPVKTGFPRMD